MAKVNPKRSEKRNCLILLKKFRRKFENFFILFCIVIKVNPIGDQMKITRRQLRSLIESIILNEGPGGGDRGGNVNSSPARTTAKSVKKSDTRVDADIGDIIESLKGLPENEKAINVAQLVNYFVHGKADYSHWAVSWILPSSWGTNDDIFKLLDSDVLTISELEKASVKYDELFPNTMRVDLRDDLDSGEITLISNNFEGFRSWLDGS